MKLELDPAIIAMRGTAGNFTYRKIRGKPYMGPRRQQSEGTPTEGQLAQRERFNDAVAYGKTAMSDPEVRALYEAEAKERGMPYFALMIADFFKAPTIKSVDLSSYTGHKDSLIKVKAKDNFMLATVHVSIVNSSDMPIENGNAVETAPNSGSWVYTATFNVPSETSLKIRVVATDLPGGTAVQEETLTLP